MNKLDYAHYSHGRIVSVNKDFAIKIKGINTHNRFTKVFVNIFGSGTIAVKVEGKTRYLNKNSCYKLVKTLPDAPDRTAFMKDKKLILASIQLAFEQMSKPEKLEEPSPTHFAHGMTEVTEDFFDEIKKMPNLTSLNFQCTNFHGLNPEKLAELPPLTSLGILCCDNFTDESMQSLSNQTALTSFQIGPDNLITDEGIKSIANLKSLTSLKLLACENLTDECLETIATLPHLTSLDLSCCHFTDKGLEIIGKMKHLTSLDLSNCYNITNMKALEALPNLTSLTLRRCNGITNEGFKAFAKLPHLKSLDLTDCNNADPAALEEGLTPLTNLTALNLSDCGQITDIGFLQKLKTSLTSLSLSNCIMISDQSLKTLGKMPQLTSINLNNCRKVTDQGLKELKALTHLTSLNLDHCSIKDQGLKELLELTNLTTLSLSGCSAITVKGFETLGQMLSLKELILGSCPQIRDEHLQKLQPLPNLVYLNLSQFNYDLNKFTTDGLSKVIKLPALGRIGISFCNNINIDELKKIKPGLIIQNEMGI